MDLDLPDLAVPVKLASINGSFATKEREDDVSAISHARDRFNNVSPNSLPH